MLVGPVAYKVRKFSDDFARFGDRLTETELVRTKIVYSMFDVAFEICLVSGLRVYSAKYLMAMNDSAYSSMLHD